MRRNNGPKPNIFCEERCCLKQLILRSFWLFSSACTSQDTGNLDSTLRNIGIKISMYSHANTWNEPEQFDLYIKKFRSLFTMHNVGFGSPDDFPHFMVKLAQDRHFAMDFWGLTGTLSKREGGELSVDQTLAVIVDAVVDADISEKDEGTKTLIDELAALLSGVDLYSPSRQSDSDAEDEESEPSLVSSYSPSRQSDAEDKESEPSLVSSPIHPVHKEHHSRFAEMTERAAGEVLVASRVSSSTAPAQPESAPVANAVASEQSQSSASTAKVHQFDEALMRLEMNSLELKEHLEDLDKKMSRIVPHLEVLSSKISSAEPHSSRFEEPLAREVEIPVRRSAEKPRLVLEETEGPVSNKPPVSTPFAGYAEPKKRRGNGAVVAMVILFAWIVGGLVLHETYGSPVWKRAGATVRERYDALLEKAHTTNTEQVAANSSEPSPATAAVSDGSSAVNSPPPIEGNAPAQPIAEHTDTSVDASQAPENKYHSRSSRGTAHPVSAETIEKAPAERVPSSGNEVANAVNVAPAVMEEHLVASRVPAYPEKAKENRIEGPVVVQAIISKDGFVDRVHVLEGDPHLRSAAAEAVQKWRFKPYLLNGRPVEVATTITVDFKIDDW